MRPHPALRNRRIHSRSQASEEGISRAVAIYSSKNRFQDESEQRAFGWRGQIGPWGVVDANGEHPLENYEPPRENYASPLANYVTVGENYVTVVENYATVGDNYASVGENYEAVGENYVTIV